MDWGSSPWKTSTEQSSIFAHPRANEFALPAAFALSVAAHPIGLWGFSAFFYHELGHAAAAWLCGRWAVPIPIAGYTIWGLERSWFFTALAFAGLGRLWAWAWSASSPRVLAAATAGLILAAYLLIGVSAQQEEGWVIYGGCAGEIVFSAAAVLAFYWDAPEFLRWDFWRWPVLLSGALLLAHCLLFWGAARRAPDRTMMGESVAASRESDQDWVRLVRGHGWTSSGIAASYDDMGLVAAVLVALQYLAGLGGAKKKDAGDGDAGR